MNLNETIFGKGYLVAKTEYVDGKSRLKNITLMDYMRELGFIDHYGPVETLSVTLAETGWNTYEVLWDFESSFILAHSFSNSDTAAYDVSSLSTPLWYLEEEANTWKYVVDENNSIVFGNWGIKASISYEGIDVAYDLYKSENLFENGVVTDDLLKSGLTGSSYVDSSVITFFKSLRIPNHLLR